MNKQINIAILVAILLLMSACGDNTDEAKYTTITGKVLDGPVNKARVCLDKDGDRQCTDYDEYVVADQDGVYTMRIKDDGNLSAYSLIADIRSSEAEDSDYESGKPDYDYVMKGFEVTDGENVISPISTYVDWKRYDAATGSKRSQDVALGEVRYQIVNNELFSFGQLRPEQEIIDKDLIKGDYSQDSGDDYDSNYNKRLHNINEVLARKMQDSQIGWEDKLYNGDVTLENRSWSENSALVIDNAQASVFNGFEDIVKEVGSVDYNNFNAKEIADKFSINYPTNETIQDLLDYNDYLGEVSSEFSGQTIKFSMTTTSYYDNSSTTMTFYYHLDNNGELEVYMISDLLGCLTQSAPLPVGTGGDFMKNLQTTIDQMNSSGMTGVTYSDAVIVSAPPSSCSTLDDLLANMGTTVNTDSSYEPNTIKYFDYANVDVSSQFEGQGMSTVPNQPKPTATSMMSTPTASGNGLLRTCSSAVFCETDCCAKAVKN